MSRFTSNANKMRTFLLATCLLLSTGASAFGQDVTFRVDMRNETVNGPVRLTGGFAGWYDGKLEMADPDNDDIYELTLRLLPGRYEYKYLKGNWSGAESLSSPSAAYCTINSSGNTNRILEVGQSDTLLPVVCFDSCLACGPLVAPTPVPVTFQVNMAALGSGATYVTGNSLDNWCGNCIPMSDIDGDLIYEATVQMMPGTHEFKFTRNGWSTGESLIAGGACTVTNFGFTNRSVYVPVGGGPLTLPAAPFGGCAAPPVNVYLEVDLNGVQADPSGVFVAGTFNNWSTTATPLEDLGHGIWGRNIVATAGETIRYRFYNGSSAEIVPPTCDDNLGTRTQVVPSGMTRAAAVCWSGCGPCADVRHLVWADEFNGTAIDTDKWNFDLGNGVGGWGNTEQQYYTSNASNARLLNGNLEITARLESLGGFNYTSARMTTKNKGDFTYGRIEARLKSPETQALWPAFWMLPTDNVYGGWPSSGEIDVFELIGSEPDRAHGTVHFGPTPGAGHFWDGEHYDLPGSPDYADGFHIFAVEWEPNEIRWYMDSVLFHSVSPWEIGPCDWPFDQDMHILLNVAVGGYWPGYPNAATQLPQTMTVDYVRVYAPGPVSAAAPAPTPTLVISPNPTTGDFTLDLGLEPKGAVQVEVLDLHGRVVLAQALRTRQARLSLGDAPAGVYVLRVEAGKGSQVSKLIKVD